MPQRQPTTADRIRVLLAERSDLRATEIAEALGVALPTVHDALTRLLAAREVSRARRLGGGQGGPYLWRLGAPEPEPAPKPAPVPEPEPARPLLRLVRVPTPAEPARLVRLPTPEVVAMRAVVEAARQLVRETRWAELGGPGAFDDLVWSAVEGVIDAVLDLDDAEEETKKIR